MRRPASYMIMLVLVALLLQSLPYAPFVMGQEAEAPGSGQEETSPPSGEESGSQVDEGEPGQDEQTPQFIPGQLIISFQPEATPEEIESFYQQYGLVEMDDLNPAAAEDAQATRLTFVPVEVNQDLIDTLGRDPLVAFAEPNYVFTINKTPDDPDYSKLWGLNNTGQTGGSDDADIDAAEGWDVTTGSSDVIVAVIDTGVDYTHEDLAGNMWTNPGECPNGNCEANGEDDDGNGYVDDFHGINAITDSGDPMDDYGHGTHVAGTIGAAGNNGTGVVGVNWKVQILGCKFLSASGSGSSAGAIKCFNYVRQLKNEYGQNIVATNNSWGGGAPTEALRDAMAGDDQPLHICAAGNSNSSAPHYPGAYDLENIISVAATDHADMYAGFSNYGDTVDLAAPGDSIFSTVPTGSCAMCDPSGYGSSSGTSMATPHVAGAVALIAAKYPDLELLQIRQRILTGYDPLTDETKTTITNGRLNVFNTLEEDETPPAPVADLSVTGLLMTQIRLTWTATGDDGMAGTANAYDVRYATQPITPENWQNATQAVGAPKPSEAGETETYALPGLEPNTTYYIALKVLDNVGNESDLSNVVIAKTNAGTVVFEDNMENGEGEWEIVGTDALWHLSELRSNSPTHAWYYGDEESRSYDTGSATTGMLVSPEIELTSNEDVLLVFHEWSELESSDTYDRTRVQISLDGKVWETVFESHGTNDEWMKRTVNLTPYLGDTSTVWFRFWFDSIDNRFNDFEGWYIDDVTLLVSEPSTPGEGQVQANLVMQESNIGFSVPEPIDGDSVTVYAIVMNSGAEEASDVQVQFMDVTGAEEGAAPVPIGTPVTLPNVPVGGSATAQIVYDTTGKAGERAIQVLVDPFNLVAESNEADNSAHKVLTVAEQPAPNLVVRTANIGFNPAQPQLGDQVTVNAVVMNEGSLEVSEVVVRFFDVTASGAARPVGEPQVIDTLMPGGSAAVQVTYDTASGEEGDDRKLQVVVDPQNVIVESNKDDNEATATLSLVTGDLPNLSISTTGIGFSPAKPQSGEPVTVVATILNDGSVTVAETVVQFFDASGSSSIPIGDPQVIGPIAPGASATAQVVYPTQGRAGDRKIEVVVDPNNFITERSETDNSAKVTLSVTPPPAPNLTMLASNIGFEPHEPVHGETVIIRAVVLNSGNADASDVTVQFMDTTNGTMTPIGERQTVPLIIAGSSAVVSVSLDTAGLAVAGERIERRIQVSVDPNNFIGESNEEDNEASRLLTVVAQPAPNLTMSAANIAFDPVAPVQGDDVAITAVILNTGSAVANRVLVQFVDVTNGGFDPIGLEQTIESVPVGSSASVQTTYSTAGPAGSRKIRVLVDSNNLIAETDETDNEAVTTLLVEPSPMANLVVLESGIGFRPLEPQRGDEVEVTVTVHNRGTAGAETVLVQLLDVSDGEASPVGAPAQIDEIVAGSAAVVTFAYDTSGEAGERRLRVVVDPGNFIPETDETDNRASATLAVGSGAQPNLVVRSSNIGFRPPGPVQGTLVTLTVSILNVGSAEATDVLVQFVDATGGGAEPIDAKQTVASIPAGGVGQAQVTYDTTEKAGERRIRVVADPHQTIAESQENDNEAIATLMVEPGPLPNLVALEANIGFSTVEPNQGEVVTVTATILNNGSAAANDVAVQFMDVTGGGASPIAANQVIAAIEPGGAGVAQIAYDTSGRSGERKIQVVVDPNNLTPETDVNDNRAVATLVVRRSPVPNLVVRSSHIGFNPPTPNDGDTVEVYATIRNDGDAPASDVVVHILDVTGGGSVLLGEAQTIPSIAGGGSALVQTTLTMGTTDRKVEVVVDSANVIFESSESDNRATATVSPAEDPIANLTMLAGNITFDKTEPVAGEMVTVNIVVLNTGSADAGEVVVQIADDTGDNPVPIGPQQVIPGIPAGGSASLQVMYDTTGKTGERTIQVTADPNNLVPESKDTDNSAQAVLTVVEPAKPNVVMLSGNIGLNPAGPTEGDMVTIQAVILNHGGVEARDVVIQFMDATNGSLVPIETPQTIARIPAGSGAVAQVTYDTTGKQGERIVHVIADPNNFIVETDETDNQASKTFAVAPPPKANLVVLSSNVSFDPTEPNDGDLVEITAEILNNGSVAAVDVVVRIVDVTAGEPVLIGKPRLIDTILPGQTGTAQVTFDTTDKAGDRKVRVIADPGNVVAESDETDNETTVQLVVEPPPAPNLVMESSNIKFSPASPSDGDMVTIRATVQNAGLVVANKVEVKFVDVTNGGNVPIGSVQTIGSIDAGSSATAEVLYDATGKTGERTIQVVVDPNNLIPEMDEEDNQAEAMMTVSPPSEEPAELPNLVVTADAISFDPAQPAPGDAVTITVVVTNSGEADASSVVVRFSNVTGGDPEQIGEDQTIASIPAGDNGSAAVVLDTTGMSGAIDIQVVADPDDAIEETDEDDNAANKTLTLGGAGGEDPGDEDTSSVDSLSSVQEDAAEDARPNLVVRSSAIQVAAVQSTGGPRIRLDVTITNEGEVPSASVPLLFREWTPTGVMPIGTPVVLDAIPAGGVATATVEYVRPDADGVCAGAPCQIGVTVDPENLVRESSELDNEARTLLPSID